MGVGVWDVTKCVVLIYCPLQQPCSDAEPTPYPWTLDLIADNAAVQDIEILNPYNAVRAVLAGRHSIARIQGQPLHTGLFVDKTYDIGRVENVPWNPWFCKSVPFMRHQLTCGRAFVVARSDWEYFFNTFAFGYSIGYHFIESADGACNGNFLGIGKPLPTTSNPQPTNRHGHGH